MYESSRFLDARWRVTDTTLCTYVRRFMYILGEVKGCYNRFSFATDIYIRRILDARWCFSVWKILGSQFLCKEAL